MKHFRSKVALLYGMGFSMLSLLLFCFLLAFIYVDLRSRERKELEQVADNIRAHLEEYGRSARNESLGDAVTGLNEKISFAFSEEDLNLGYAVFSEQGHLLYEFYRTPHSPFVGITPSVPLSEKMFERWISYKDCVFYHWLPAGPHRIVVSCAHRITYIDRLLNGVAIALSLSVILSLLMGHILGRHISEPLAAIAATAARIEAGDLTTRIPDLKVDEDTTATVRALNHTFAELESSFQRVSQFSSDVAHELKTPLTAIRGSLEVALSRSRSVEDCQGIMAQIVADIADMSRFVDDLLMLSRPGALGAESAFEPVCVKDLVARVCDGLSGSADARGVDLRHEALGDVRVSGHRPLLTRMLSNLVANAIQFSRAGGCVKVTADLRGDAVVMRVSDAGIGIAPEHLNRVFDRLYQVDSTRGAGHGLGLAIVKWISEMHDATISVQSTPREGTTFAVVFPTRPPSSTLP